MASIQMVFGGHPLPPEPVAAETITGEPVPDDVAPAVDGRGPRGIEAGSPLLKCWISPAAVGALALRGMHIGGFHLRPVLRPRRCHKAG